jgi:cyanophycinase-like exopeptidase
MAKTSGTIALMGSGELTATMVEVHKALLSRFPEEPKAAFIDTPAGFQLNADEISHKAVDYFKHHVQRKLMIASYKSRTETTVYDAEQAFQILRKADFMLMGPGSPTYAVRQFQQSPIPQIIEDRIRAGACLVAASAAALTIGRFTLPVYEIYKVGQKLHWVDGMDILARFGFNLVIVPHWNNAEGGTHDTRFCFMGEPRFRRLEKMLPEDVSILGLDEHSACIIDFTADTFDVRGIGTVTLRHAEQEKVFQSGKAYPLGILRGEVVETPQSSAHASRPQAITEMPAHASFWDTVHSLEGDFRIGLETKEPKQAVNALLELDRVIWQAANELENVESIIQARDTLREMIVSLGLRLEHSPQDELECLKPLVENLLDLRQRLREAHQWQAADAIRDTLAQSDVLVEDTGKGFRWKLKAE